MRVTLIRHTSVDVPPGTCYGQTDVALKPSFPEESRKVFMELGQLQDMVYDGVYTSPLSRCTRLADACGYPDAIRDESLMEMNFGEWEMKRFDELSDPRLQSWYDDWFHVPATGGESMELQVERVTHFLNHRKAEGKRDILVFTHGGVILSAMLAAGMATRERIFDHLPSYGEIFTMEFR